MKSLLITLVFALVASSFAAEQISNKDIWDADWKFGGALVNDDTWVPPLFDVVSGNCSINNVTSSSNDTTEELWKFKAFNFTLESDSFVKALALVSS